MLDNMTTGEKVIAGATAVGIAALIFHKPTRKTVGLADGRKRNTALKDAYWGNYDNMDRFKYGFKPVQPIIDPELITEEKEAKIRRFIKKNKELAGDMRTFIGTEGSILDQFINWLDSTYYGKESKYVGVKPRNSKYLKHNQRVFDIIKKTKTKLPDGIEIPVVFQVLAQDKQYAQWERKKAETEANIRRINKDK